MRSLYQRSVTFQRELRTEADYLAIREVSVPNLQMPPYVLMRLQDGYYAVFKDNGDLFEYDLLFPEHFENCEVDCVYGCENAFYISAHLH